MEGYVIFYNNRYWRSLGCLLVTRPLNTGAYSYTAKGFMLLPGIAFCIRLICTHIDNTAVGYIPRKKKNVKLNSIIIEMSYSS